MPRAAALLLLAAVTLPLAGCDPGPDHPYPPDVVENFVTSCRAKGSQAACECAIDQLQRRFTLAEFNALEARMAKGEVPPEVVNAIADCPPR